MAADEGHRADARLLEAGMKLLDWNDAHYRELVICHDVAVVINGRRRCHSDETCANSWRRQVLQLLSK